MTTLDVTTTDIPRGVHVKLAGELDLATVPKLDDEMKRIEDAGPELILLDLQALSFMDSSGLRSLLGADGRAQEAGRRLVLVRGDERVQRVLRITRLDERLEIVDSPEAVG
ncbi:MAG TPA: STAS domain-containing protein [Thermoleophilaceae bacterium]|jgi:anti-sigma B factor antagonist